MLSQIILPSSNYAEFVHTDNNYEISMAITEQLFRSSNQSSNQHFDSSVCLDIDRPVQLPGVRGVVRSSVFLQQALYGRLSGCTLWIHGASTGFTLSHASRLPFGFSGVQLLCELQQAVQTVQWEIFTSTTRTCHRLSYPRPDPAIYMTTLQGHWVPRLRRHTPHSLCRHLSM